MNSLGPRTAQGHGTPEALQVTALDDGGEGLSLFKNAMSQQLLRPHLKQVALTPAQKPATPLHPRLSLPPLAKHCQGCSGSEADSM